MSHSLDWNAAVELPLRHLREKTPPMFVGSIREHEHLPPRFRVRQGHSVSDEVLRGIPGPNQLRGLFSGRTRQVRRHSYSATGDARHMLLQEHTKRPNDLCHSRQRRAQPVYSRQTLHQLACSLGAPHCRPKAVNRSGSCLTFPCEYTFPHHAMLVSKKCTFKPQRTNRPLPSPPKSGLAY